MLVSRYKFTCDNCTFTPHKGSLTCKEHHLKMEHSQIAVEADGRGGMGDGSQMSELHLREFPGRATTVVRGLRHIPL